MVQMEMAEKDVRVDGLLAEFLMQFVASRRIPVPPSNTRIWFVSVRISIHEVLPPNPMFSRCGVGVEPRTPQKRTRIQALLKGETPSIKSCQNKLQGICMTL